MNQFQAMIEKNNTLIEGGIGLALGVLVREFEARSAALEAQINGLRSEFAYKGMWTEGKHYKRGNFVTLGSVWHAACDTTSKPGSDSDWTLVIAKPRDGRDGKDYEPPPPRTVRTHR